MNSFEHQLDLIATTQLEEARSQRTVSTAQEERIFQQFEPHEELTQIMFNDMAMVIQNDVEAQLRLLRERIELCAQRDEEEHESTKKDRLVDCDAGDFDELEKTVHDIDDRLYAHAERHYHLDKKVTDATQAMH